MRRKLGDALRSFRVLGGDLQWRVLLQVIHKENLAVKYLQAQAKKKNAGTLLGVARQGAADAGLWRSGKSAPAEPHGGDRIGLGG